MALEFPSPLILGPLPADAFAGLQALSSQHGSTGKDGHHNLVAFIEPDGTTEVSAYYSSPRQSVDLQEVLAAAEPLIGDVGREWLNTKDGRPRYQILSYTADHLRHGATQLKSHWHPDIAAGEAYKGIMATDVLETEFAIGALTGTLEKEYVLCEAHAGEEGWGETLDRSVDRAIAAGQLRISEPQESPVIFGFDFRHKHRSTPNNTGKTVFRNFFRFTSGVMAEAWHN